jgi:hypothetical protein
MFTKPTFKRTENDNNNISQRSWKIYYCQK